jgi:alkylation response protein AidB-like acyl-CoA dehydrogenase
MTGDAEFTEVFLDSVAIPGDALLGPLDGGWGVAMGVLGDERGSSDASGLIGLDRRLAGLATLAASSGPSRDQLADVLVRGHALRSMLVASAGGPGAGSAAKLLRTELELDAAGLAVDLSGPAGMLAGRPTDGFLYSPGMKIAGGSSEIQRNIIAERVLGLPRDPRPDR